MKIITRFKIFLFFHGALNRFQYNLFLMRGVSLKDYSSHKYLAYRSLLKSAFVFEDTREGKQYWDDLALKWTVKSVLHDVLCDHASERHPHELW